MWMPQSMPRRTAMSDHSPPKLRVPSELLLLLSDPLMGPAITKFVIDVKNALTKDRNGPPLSDSEETVEKNPQSLAAWKRRAEAAEREREQLHGLIEQLAGRFNG